jgi:hypothetical protein
MPDGRGQEGRDADWVRTGDRAPEALSWLYAHDPWAV